MQLIKTESAAMACISGPHDASLGQSSSAGSLRDKSQSSWWLAVLLVLSSDRCSDPGWVLRESQASCVLWDWITGGMLCGSLCPQHPKECLAHAQKCKEHVALVLVNPWSPLASSFRHSRPEEARSRGLRGCSKLGFSFCDQHLLFCVSLPGWDYLLGSPNTKQYPRTASDLCLWPFPGRCRENAPSSKSRDQLCLWNFDSPLICFMISLASLNPIITAANVYIYWGWELWQLISGSP